MVQVVVLVVLLGVLELAVAAVTVVMVEVLVEQSALWWVLAYVLRFREARYPGYLPVEMIPPL